MFDLDSLLQAVTAPKETGTPVHDPATGSLVGYARSSSVSDLDAAVAAASIAQRSWAAIGHEARSATLSLVADRIDESAEALAQLITREQGKPLNGGARIEAGHCSQWLRAAAAAIIEPEVVVDEDGLNAVLSYGPIGVVGAIGPWNWPVMISVWQFANALRMGNAVVLKPSEYTPLSVSALIEIANQELPENVLMVVPGGHEIGARLAEHPGIGKIMFTGSIATGRQVVASSAKNLARLTLELGGNDAGIVLPDASIEQIVGDLFFSAFMNVGQTCGALKRLYVPDSLYDQVCDALAGMAASIPMGVGTDEAMVLGPVNNENQWKVVDRLVEAAKDSGARIVAGGEPDRQGPGFFYPVTIVADIAPDHPLVMEEQFGPALPVIRYGTIDEAVAEANKLDVGLVASVWSSDTQKALEVGSRLVAGTITINRHGIIDPRIPFGGVKNSGYGLEFGMEGLKAVALPRVVVS